MQHQTSRDTAAIEQLVKAGLQRAQIQFPGQLGACLVLFVGLCLLDLVSPCTAAAVFDALTPGATLLAKWLPVFFVPGLALLPLSKSIPGTVDVSCGIYMYMLMENQIYI